MKYRLSSLVLASALLVNALSICHAQAQKPDVPEKNALVIVKDGKTSASVVVAADAGPFEKEGADDLVKYIEMMSGAKPALVNTIPTGAAIVVGKAALAADASLQKALDGVKKKNPTLRADAIVMRRTGNRVYLAGTNDQSHQYATSQLLQNWGCRWYMPTEFGEAIPEKKTLTVGTLNFAYAPPFEVRSYWLSWNGSGLGAAEFQRRNFMTANISLPGSGHALGQYVKNVIPEGKSLFNVSFSDPATAVEVAKQIEADYAAGKDISVAIEDGNYANDSPSDKALITEYDKYMMKPSLTDAMLTLYNNVGKILREKYPNSKAKIGGMAYVNVTMPPKIVTKVEPNVVMWIAPIDIDPNHGMDDPTSPPRMEYREMVENWSKVVEGRLAIYDYDQGMLVWRDLPNPSQHAFARDAKIYAKANILGISTESRGGMATVFLNLFFRGQLMWNPNADVDALTAEFYPKFYGPAAEPMARYWNALFNAWENTVVTEHEYMAIPAIYTPQLVAQMQRDLEQAEALMQPLAGKTGRNDRLYQERMRFTRLSFDTIQNYTKMITAAASENNYKQAAEFGAKALEARLAIANMNPTFTTRVIEPAAESEANGPAWFPGEVAQYRNIGTLTDGTKGTLVAQTPLEWWFKRGEAIPAGYEYHGMEGATPKGDITAATQEANAANGWRPLRTDIYVQGQGILTEENQSELGHYWYQTTLDLTPEQTAGDVHLMFPGLFNEAWLYVNGELVGHREYNEPWWYTDYKFEWDVSLKGKLKPGKNVISVRGFNPHHFAGMFRRPFVYRAVG